MKNLIVILVVVFALLSAPLAQAAGISCQENCQVSEQTTHSESEKQDSGKLDKAAHHCCCAHAAFKEDRIEEGRIYKISTVFVTTEDHDTKSIVLGPPLKPPSHA
jgi:hypothetical protein